MLTPRAGINGFGRFGLGLFRAWFEDPGRTYEIAFLNDDALTIGQIAQILKYDPVVTAFHHLDIGVEGDRLQIRRADGALLDMEVTTGAVERARWRAEPQIIFECSSRASNFTKYADETLSGAQVVLIGATTDAADATLIVGLNEQAYNARTCRVISFGSCTVIPGVHVINMVQSTAGVRDVLVNIVHSVPKWQLDAGRWTGLGRKSCTLEVVAPTLVGSVLPEQVKVNYTYAPYYGASVMDFAFRLVSPLSAAGLLERLTDWVDRHDLGSIIGFADTDLGGAAHTDAHHSIKIIKSSIDVRGERAFFFGYFNNEGSGIRLHELAESIVRAWP